MQSVFDDLVLPASMKRALAVSFFIHAALIICVQRDDAVDLRPVAKAPLQLTKVTWVEAPTPVARSTGGGAATVTKKSKPAVKKQRALVADLPRVEGSIAPSMSGLELPVEESHGTTLTPSMVPSREEVLAEDEARVTTRVDDLLRHGLAAARVNGGLPDPTYGVLGDHLRDATKDVPRFIDTEKPKEVMSALVDGWRGGAERYGKTGSPYDTPEGWLESIEKPSAIVDGVQRGSPDAISIAQFFAAGARLQEFADGRAGVELYALVEIRQQSGGHVDSITMIRPSGMIPFDTWVLDRAKDVGTTFTYDAGFGKRPLRSVWRFDGILKFRRKMKLKELDGRAALGMISMAALSMLSSIGNQTKPPEGILPADLGPRMPAFTGRFDEMTGEMDFVDLTNPTYACKVTLIEAD